MDEHEQNIPGEGKPKETDELLKISAELSERGQQLLTTLQSTLNESTSVAGDVTPPEA